ncbi:MAG TPA: FxsA family protein [Campylobacterales bacterium]|nr:FxsA family protein [Campylobacterales bacterium]
MPFVIIYLFIEVLVSVEFASQLGGLLTFLEIIVSAFIGLFLLTNFRYTLSKSMNGLMSGAISAQDFQKMSLFTLIGAVLLIIPGFFSDILGVLLQFSFFGKLFASKILNLKNKKNIYREGKNDAIDVEVIDSDTIK